MTSQITWYLAPFVQTLNSAIHRIKIYPVDNSIGFPVTYPLYSDLSGGWRYPTFEQPGPGCFPIYGVWFFGPRFKKEIPISLDGCLVFVVFFPVVE